MLTVDINAAAIAAIGLKVYSALDLLVPSVPPTPTHTPISDQFDELQPEMIHRHQYDHSLFPDDAMELGTTVDGKEYCLLTNVPGPSVYYIRAFSLHHLLDEGCDGKPEASIEGHAFISGGTRLELQKRQEWPEPFRVWADDYTSRYIKGQHLQEALRAWRATKRR